MSQYLFIKNNYKLNRQKFNCKSCYFVINVEQKLLKNFQKQQEIIAENISVVKNVEISKGLKMISLDDLTPEQAKTFKLMVDECILENSEKPEMKEGLAYIDELANDQKMSIYDLLLNLYTVIEAVEAIDKYEDEEKDK